MGLKDLFIRKKSVQMVNAVTHVEQDTQGNWWYLSSYLGHRSRWKATYDMLSPKDKASAMMACTPLGTVLDKVGSMMSRGTVYITDKNGNERPRFSEYADLLNSPNPLQNFQSFIKQIEINLRLFGFCPLSLVRGFEGVIPASMWVLPPEFFHLESTGKYAFQTDIDEVVKRAYLDWGGTQIEFAPWEYVIIHDGCVSVPSLKGADITFRSSTDNLSQPVSNWVASMSASHTLLVNGGPKGIISGAKIDEMGNTAITPADEDRINEKFKSKYGLVGKEYPIMVVRPPLTWIPLDFDADKLKLHEEDSRCTAAICNAIGLNPNLFNDAKYDNQESAKKAAYQDVVIPDSVKIASYLTKAICPEGVFIKIDFSGVECLQANKEMEANTLLHAADALERLMASRLITPYEARIEVARYIDIDPDKPKGDYRETVENANNVNEEGGEDGQDEQV